MGVESSVHWGRSGWRATASSASSIPRREALVRFASAPPSMSCPSLHTYTSWRSSQASTRNGMGAANNTFTLSRASSQGRIPTPGPLHSRPFVPVTVDTLREEQEKMEVKYVRSALEDYRRRKAARPKVVDPYSELRKNPMNWGCHLATVTETAEAYERPVRMAEDPKWTSDIKRIDGKVGDRLKWGLKIAGAVPGSMAPELQYMPPQTYMSAPPTPISPHGDNRTCVSGR